MKKYNVVVVRTGYEYFDGIKANSSSEAIAKLRDYWNSHNARPDCLETPEWHARAYRADECVDHEHVEEEF